MAKVSDNLLHGTVTTSVMFGIHTFYVTQAFTASIRYLRQHTTIEEPQSTDRCI